MKKQYLVIGIITAVVALLIGKGVSKQSAQNAYHTYLENEQKTYESVQVDNIDVSKNNFVHNIPKFSLGLPSGLSLIKAIDNNGIVAYKGETDDIMCQLQIRDGYTLMNMKSQNIERRMLDYNMYSKTTMDATYDAYVKSTIASSPYGDVINVVHSVQKISDKIFIYIEYEIPGDDENMMRKSYNFLVNGYSITVVGLFFKNNKIAEASVNDFLKSIVFN